MLKTLNLVNCIRFFVNYIIQKHIIYVQKRIRIRIIDCNSDLKYTPASRRC